MNEFAREQNCITMWTLTFTTSWLPRLAKLSLNAVWMGFQRINHRHLFDLGPCNMSSLWPVSPYYKLELAIVAGYQPRTNLWWWQAEKYGCVH